MGKAQKLVAELSWESSAAPPWSSTGSSERDLEWWQRCHQLGRDVAPAAGQGAPGELQSFLCCILPSRSCSSCNLTLPFSRVEQRCRAGADCPLSPFQTLQEQQAARAQSLAELSRWLGQAEDTLAEQQRAEGDLPALQQRQSDVKVSDVSKLGGHRWGGVSLGVARASRHRPPRSCRGACTAEPPPSPAS